MSMFINSAWAGTEGAATGQATTPFPLLITMGVVFIVMYFMSIRPQQKRQKQAQEMLTALSKGDEVVFAGGLLGRVSKLQEDFVTVEVASNVELKVQKSCIMATLPKGTLKSV